MNAKELLKWQKVVVKNSPNKLVMTEKQLLDLTKVQAQNHLRIVQDCSRIMKETGNPDTFFSRLEVLRKNTEALAVLAPFLKPYASSKTMTSINNVCNAMTKEQIYIREFVTRLPVNAKNYRELSWYFDCMDRDNLEYTKAKFKEVNESAVTDTSYMEASEEEIKKEQEAKQRYENTGDIDAYIRFWEDVWANGGPITPGSIRMFTLPDLYIKEKRYDDAMHILKLITEKDKNYTEKAESYMERVNKLKNKGNS